jgi:benzoate/toluate 1,2-dioxygenase reductase subunit
VEEMMSPSRARHEAREYSTKLLARRWLTEKVFEIELTRPYSFQFTPGQRIRFSPETRQRDYSLLTTPSDSTLGLCLFNVEKGQFSPVLAAAEIGTKFSFTGPHGYFTYRPSARPAVFVATGTGIAPFLSISRSGVTEFTLLHGVGTASDLHYQDFLRSTARLYVPCLSASPDQAGTIENGFDGRVTHYLKEYFPPDTYDFYLCGRQEMIRDVTLLVDERFPGSLVYAETFF